MISKRVFALAGLLAALGLAGCGGDKPEPKAAAPQVINFSIQNTETQQSVAALWQPLLDDLSKALGVPVKPFFASNYTALIEAMRFNQVQAGWFSALPALEAVRRAGGEVAARTVDVDGLDSYTSMLITRADSKLDADSLAKCGKKLAFGMGDAKSLSGTLAPLTFYFTPRKIDPNTCFKAVRSANHQNNLFAVANGVLDASTMNSVGMTFARREQPEAAKKVKVIWTSPALPESAFVLKSDMDPAMKAKFRAFLTGYGKAPGAEGERQRKILTGLNYSAFRAADDSYLSPVLQMSAAQDLAEARRGGDAAKIAAAQAAYDTAQKGLPSRAGAAAP